MVANWKEYIDGKFIPTSEFPTNHGLSIKNIRTGTSVWFFGASASWDKIEDIHFYSDRTKGWSGESGPVEFSSKGMEVVDRVLDPVFNTGWTSRDIYLFGSHFKSIVHYNKEQQGPAFHYWSSDLGCASIVLFPILALLGGLVRLAGMTDLKTIEPINRIA